MISKEQYEFLKNRGYPKEGEKIPKEMYAIICQEGGNYFNHGEVLHSFKGERLIDELILEYELNNARQFGLLIFSDDKALGRYRAMFGFYPHNVTGADGTINRVIAISANEKEECYKIAGFNFQWIMIDEDVPGDVYDYARSRLRSFRNG